MQGGVNGPCGCMLGCLGFQTPPSEKAFGRLVKLIIRHTVRLGVDIILGSRYGREHQEASPRPVSYWKVIMISMESGQR